MVSTRRKVAAAAGEGGGAAAPASTDKGGSTAAPASAATGAEAQAAAAEEALAPLLARPTLLLAPSAAEREAVLQASSQLFALARGFRREGIPAAARPQGLMTLRTAGCDAEQVWGQLEVCGLIEQNGLKRQIKALLKAQDNVTLLPADEEQESGEESGEESGSDEEMAREAAKMRRLARGEAVDEDGEEDGGTEEDADSSDEAGESSGKTASKAKRKKHGDDAFWDEMDKFVQQGEEEEAEEEEEERRSRKKKKTAPVVVSESNADAIEFVVAGCGTDDVEGVYRRNDKICKFGVAYSNGGFTLLFERGGTKLSNKDLVKTRIEKSRWILFNDANGVYGDEPYYEATGSFEQVCWCDARACVTRLCWCAAGVLAARARAPRGRRLGFSV